MSGRDEGVKEVVRGLDGLIMLSQWQLTLTRDLRAKAEALESPENPAASSEDTGPEESA